MFFNDAYALREHDRLEYAQDQYIRRQMDTLKNEEFNNLRSRVQALEEEINALKRTFEVK